VTLLRCISLQLALGVFHCGAQNFDAIGGTADIHWPPAPIASEAYDPEAGFPSRSVSLQKSHDQKNIEKRHCTSPHVVVVILTITASNSPFGGISEPWPIEPWPGLFHCAVSMLQK
jgi:hypothetical protein